MSAPTPVRLHRSRGSGSRLVSPNGLAVICVTRGTRWGNPYLVATYQFQSSDGTPSSDPEAAREMAVRDFEAALHLGILRVTTEDVRRELRGFNLACWCPLSAARCHADVLLEIANAPRFTPRARAQSLEKAAR